MLNNRLCNTFLLVMCGVLLGIVVFEAGVRVIRGKPPSLTDDENFRWAYVDIHEPFFVREGEVYVSRRIRAKRTRFTVRKPPGEKRVFIIGESVATHFEDEVLKDKFREVLPHHNWTVINCGMGGYDSYRILLVMKEILRYQPDVILLMMANNEGCHRPVKINHWVYRYSLIRRFWVTRIASEYMNPPVTIEHSKVNPVYQRNLEEMLRLTQSHDIPLVLCTLPVNCRVSVDHPNNFHSRDFFSNWRFLEKHPERWREVEERWDGQCFNWFLARTCRKLGQKENEEDFYRDNGFTGQVDRNDIIRKATGSAGTAVLVDLEREITGLAGGGLPDYRFFWDRTHFWPPVYALISDRIIESLYQYALRGGKHSLDEPGSWRYSQYQKTEYLQVAREVDALVRHDDVYTSALYSILRHPEADWNHFFLFSGMVRFWYENNHHLVLRLRDKVFGEDSAANKAGEMAFVCALGEIRRENREYDAAIGDFTAVIDGGERYAYARLFRGLCYYDQGDRRKADEDFRMLAVFDRRFEWLDSAFLDTVDRDPGS